MAEPPTDDSNRRFQRLREIFDRAAVVPLADRKAFVERAAGDDPTLAGDVLAMLEAHDVARTGDVRDDAQPALGDGGEAPGMQQVGPYRLLRVLGEGGMGTVYLAEQREPLRRRVAVKVIKAGMDSKAVLARFEAERRALAMMDHPCIASVFDCGVTAEGRPYFAMEYIKGIPITDYCDQNRLGFEDRLELFRKVCAGVQHAHQKGVMHRDLKPSNVLVSAQDSTPQPKIIDFGLAKATGQQLSEHTLFTEHGQILGTPEYMSPEQAGLGGLDVDTRTDVYSLGVLLYHLLVGELPFTRQHLLEKGYLEMQRIIREEEPAKPSTKISTLGDSGASSARARRLDTRALHRRLTGDVDWIVLKALEKDRTRRYQTPLELASDIERFLRTEPVLAGPPSAAYRLKKFVARNRGRVLAAAIVSLAVTGGLVISTVNYLRAQSYLALIEEMGSLVERARDLDEGRTNVIHAWHPLPSNEVALRRWVDSTDSLMQALPRLRDKYLDPANPKGPDRPSYVVGVLRDLLDQRVAALGDSLWLARQRLDHIAKLQPQPEQALRWAQFQTALRTSPKYAGFEVPLQPHLVPLGPDPTTGLFEFAHTISGDVPRRGPKGELELGAGSAIVLVLLPGAEAQVGNQSSDPAQPFYDVDSTEKEQPLATVTLEPFLLGKYEVTQAQWQRAMNHNPSFWHEGRLLRETTTHPVENVSLADLEAFLVAMDVVLPSEAQWEYACRAGTTTAWFTGAQKQTLQGYANLADATAKKEGATWDSLAELLEWPDHADGWTATAPIGSFQPNAFGLHDMAGNVFEFTADNWQELTGQSVRRPGDGLRSGGDATQGVYRGGCFRSRSTDLRSAARFSVNKQSRFSSVGFRVAVPVRRE